MSIPENDIDLFDKYVAGLLDKSELEDFNQKLESDELFSSNFQKYRLALRTVKNKAFMDDVAVAIDQETLSSPKKKFSILIAVAASVSLCIGVFFFLVNNKASKTFSDLYKPYPNILSQRSSGQTLMDKGLSNYESGYYLKAIDNFTKIQPPSDTLSFYLGLSYYSNNEIEKGIEQLELIPSTTSIFEPQKRWYLAIGYLQVKRLNECKNYLNQIKEGSFKYKEAQSLLEQLD